MLLGEDTAQQRHPWSRRRGQSLRRCLVIATDSPVGGLDSIGS
ncbi:hypothetical protein HMPREF1556_00006 [Porphyromonas sp. oral taxon 278 str. W7784]|nr:hypothetical protein HMPREF1556_00006 [Porphyromonas sp. oral taxon 278 str. W7784]